MDTPPNVENLLGGLGALMPTAVVARLMWHRRLVRLGRRKLLSWDLAWELPAAAFSAVVAGGICEYFHLGGLTAQAVVGVIAWLGPRGIEVLLTRALIAKAGQLADDDADRTAKP
jgi:hypothetical protein